MQKIKKSDPAVFNKTILVKIKEKLLIFHVQKLNNFCFL